MIVCIFCRYIIWSTHRINWCALKQNDTNTHNKACLVWIFKNFCYIDQNVVVQLRWCWKIEKLMGSFFFVIPQVFVANPNKPRSIIEALIENRRELLKLLQNLPTSKGSRGAWLFDMLLPPLRFKFKRTEIVFAKAP